ncbi:hypothetical protein Vqi01_25880 [Micromonospora qiuiae]|uniref:LppA-like lipoprotein n=1 Tax=Micromonospora qiuiae TaxID=502268 RepID=A0ABQ4JBN7_9ACTN|nr:hypothetical protein [Micromonospora qiuiae]GIJ27426.1 hypothetical protein Vqi01_25880 [Micromonospora qiuiae]
MTRTLRRLWRPTAVLAVVALLGAACTRGGDSAVPGKDDPLQTKAVAEVRSLAEAHAQAVSAAAGVALENWRTNTAPCEGRGGEIADDGRWTLTGFARLPVAPDDQITTLQRVRDAWREQGHEITEDRTFTEGDGGVVSMREAATSVTISLATNASRDRIALIVATGCYLPTEGEDPANP